MGCFDDDVDVMLRAYDLFTQKGSITKETCSSEINTSLLDSNLHN